MKQQRKNKPNADNHYSRVTKTVMKNKHNPFEVQMNKEKFTILNRSTNHRRVPGAARARDNEKRRNTLGEEYKWKNKQNTFSDRRSDQLNAFGTGKASQHAKKRSVYNLNEDEILTHKGQTLADIERFDDTAIERDDSDDENAGKLDDKYTAAAHFGGGEDDDNRNRKTVIEELIADSKKRKIERIKDNEEIVELTKKLDENWKNLIPLVGKLTKGDEVKQKPDDYDRKMREMIFERRGAPAEKLKSEEHLAQKEKDRLEKLEKDRINRMRGEIESDTKKSHRSADDLDDDYFYEEVDEDEVEEPERMIAYEINEKKDVDNDNDENEDEEDDESDEEQEDEKPVNKTKKLLSKDGETKEVDTAESEEEESSDDDDDSEEGESVDDFSDLKVDDDTDDYEVEKPMNGKALVEIKLNGDKPAEPVNAVDKKEIMDKAAKELPYTFIVPENYDSFLKLLQTHENPSLQAIIVERMLKSNHPRLSNTNYGKVATMFAYLLQYLNDVFSDVDSIEDLQNAFKLLSQLTPHLFDISQLNNVSTGKCFQQVITEKYDDFKEGNQKMYPDLDIIIYFKLVSVLYSTSDFRHPIVTPTICFINHILSRCPIRSCSDIATGLLLTTYIHEYSQLSCRFLPSALNFLNGCLTLCVPKKPIEIVRLIPPFKSPSLLVLEERTKKSLNRWNDVKNFDSKIQSKDLLKTAIIDEDFKIRAMNVTLGLIYDFMQLLSENSGIIYLVMPFIENIEKLEANLKSYPDAIQQHISNISNLIAKIQEEKKLQYLVAKERKPKPLRMLEPRVVQVYDGGRKHHSSEAKAQREKMLYKIRRETKGAMREIRKDNEFLSKLQLKKRMQGDAERKAKVNRIFAEASTQQSEFKAFDRSKKHKNKL